MFNIKEVNKKTGTSIWVDFYSTTLLKYWNDNKDSLYQKFNFVEVLFWAKNFMAKKVLEGKFKK